MYTNLHKYLIVPKHFLAVSNYWIACIYPLSLLLIGYSLYQGLYLVPPDQVQGDLFRIIYIHVPTAALSLGIYVSLAIAAAFYWIWQMKMADIAATALAIIGSITTLLALITGSIWGRPTWGTWWLWDARLTSEFILLLLYIGVICIRLGLRPQHYAKKMAAVCAILGLVDVPLVHYSVQWWYTLHQGPSLLAFTKPKIAWIMLQPLLWSMLGFAMLTTALVIHTMRIVIKCQNTETREG